MKNKLLLIIAFLFALILISGVQGAITVTNTDHKVSSADATNYAFTGVSLGTADASRIIVIGVSARAGTRNVTNMSVNFIQATFIGRQTGAGTTIEQWYAVVPSGTTGTIYVNWTGGQDRTGIGVWAINGSNGSIRDTQGDMNAPSVLIQVASNGAVIGNAFADSAGGTSTWTGITERYDEAMEGASYQTGGSDAFVSGSTLNVTCIADAGTGTADGMVVSSWYGQVVNYPTANLGTNPVDASTTSISNITFDMSCSDAVGVSKIALYTNFTGTWSANYTNTSYTNNTWLNITATGIANGKYKWGIYCNNSVGNVNWSANRTFTIDVPNVNVTLISPTNHANVSSLYQSIQCNTASLTDIVNSTLFIWNSSGNLVFSSPQPPNQSLSSVVIIGYQENGNVTNYTGDWTNPTNVYDGDWGTYGYTSTPATNSTTLGKFYVNYTKVAGSVGAFWRVKDFIGEGNLSIPSSCWGYNATALILQADSFWNRTQVGCAFYLYYPWGCFLPNYENRIIANWSCFDGTWESIRTSTRIDGRGISPDLYEEGIYWASDMGGTLLSTNVWNISMGQEDTYIWNCLGYNNLSFSNQSMSNFSFTYNISSSYVQGSSKSFAGEGDNVSFTFNLTVPNGIPYTIANLMFNGIPYPATSINDTTSYNFSATITIPSGIGNTTGKELSWYWNYTMQGAIPNKTTTPQSLNVSNVTITDCASTGGRIILTADLKDENTQAELVNSGSTQTRIEITVLISSWYNSSETWNFSGGWINDSNISICVGDNLLNYSSYRIDIIAVYDATNYVTEFWYLDNGTLNSSAYFNNYTSANISFYDLPLADSTTFLFKFTDENGLEVPRAITHVYRKYIENGTYNEVERGKGDLSGATPLSDMFGIVSQENTNGETHIHLIEEDAIYYFMITQDGNILYKSTDYNAKCLSTPCSITLSASTGAINWSAITYQPIYYTIVSNKTSRDVNMTFVTDAISQVQMVLYKYNNNNATLVNSTELIASSGTMGLNVPTTYGNTTFFVSIFKDGTFIRSEWVSFKNSAVDIFGTGGAILGGLILLALMLMAVSEGVAFIVFIILGLIIITIMTLVDLSWLALISIICAGGIIVWKLIQRRRGA